MPSTNLPYLLSADNLLAAMDDPSDSSLAIVCLGKQEQYLRAHIPTARWLDQGMLNRGVRPAPGLLPDPSALETAFAAIGLDPRPSCRLPR